MALIKCKECGKEFSDMAETCPNCGYSEKKAKEKATLKPAGERKNKYMAGILAILFFAVGAHEFYLGNTGQGLLWFLCCCILSWVFPFIFGIAAVWALIEGITLMCMNQESFDNKYNRISK